jgi:translocator protein
MIQSITIEADQQTKAQYKSLRQPAGSPPAWVFGPVWTILYASMGLASHIAYRRNPLDLRNQTLYSIQLGLNLLWTPLFFGLGRVPESLANILALDWTVLHLVRNWWGVGPAGYLMAPYAAWSLFATYLNGGIGFLNGWRIKGAEKGKAKGGKKY